MHLTDDRLEGSTSTWGKPVLADYNVEEILRDDLQRAKKRVQQSLTTFAQLLPRTPLGRIGQPHDVATVVSFLTSEDAGWITGQVIPVAGGLH